MYRALPGVLAASLLLGLGACRRSDLVGTWTGRDAQAAQVVYSFSPDGTGYRRTGDGPQEPLTYEVTAGYPNLIELVIGSGDQAEVQHGLVEVVSDMEIRLELSPAGEPAPRQLSDTALSLRRPATR
jgi:hypothetical protein